MLSIPRGSLDDDERRQIESHVNYTFEFLEANSVDARTARHPAHRPRSSRKTER